ncbi:hypothetical protein LCGC14_2414910, partial [marine sediment metagenome]
IQMARDRIAREEALNRSSNAANLVQQDSVQFLADELNKPGSNAEGNVERYDEFVESRFQERTADFPEELKALTRQRLQAPRLKIRTKLAFHQEEQRKGETFSILDKSLDDAVQEAANDPTLANIQEQIESVATLNSLYKLSGSIDEEEAQATVEEELGATVVEATCEFEEEDGEKCGDPLVKRKLDANGDPVADDNGEPIMIPDKDLMDLTKIRFRKYMCRDHFTAERKKK